MCRNDIKPLPQVGGLVTVLNRHDEQRHKPGQTVLIHGINVSQVGYTKKQNSSVHSGGSITFPSLVNLLLGDLCLSLQCHHTH